jgi:hypothetical protein
MKGVLGLAADFFDRLSNPMHAAEEHESYSARLHELLSRDAELGETLMRADLGSADVDLLSTPAWLWYLSWRRSQGAPLPAEEFIDALFERTGDLVVRLEIVEAAATDPALARWLERERTTASLEDAPPSWLRTRLLALSRQESRAEAAADRVVQATEMAVLLLQVGNDMAYIFLRAWLAEPTPFQGELRRLVEEVIRSSAGGDEESVAQWKRDLGF